MAKKKPLTKVDESAPPKKGIKGLIGGLLSPLILGGAAFAAVYLLPSSEVGVETTSDYQTHEAEGLESASYSKPYIKTDIVALKEMTLSINDSQNILRINIALETPYSKSSEIDPNDPRLRDAFMGYLRAVDVAQLEEAAFMPQLREQLLRRSKLVLGQEHVSGVLITDFLIR